jgi:Na+/proline symporter
MQLNHLDIAVVVIYLVATLGLGIAQAMKIRTSGDYYAGGRNFNKFYLMMHALGTASHADEPVSVIGGAFEKGMSGIWYTFLYLPLTPIFWLLAPFIRRTRFVTTADFFPARYNRSLGILYAIMGVLKMSVSIGVVLKGTATIMRSASGGAIDEKWSILAMTLVFMTYGFAGGLRATVVTEVIQGPLIIVMSLLMLPFGLHAAGGFAGLHHALPKAMFSLTMAAGGKDGAEFTPTWVGAMTLVALIGFIAQPGLLAAFASGKTELEGRVGYTYGTMIKRGCAIGWVLTGVILAAMDAQGHLSPAQSAQVHQRRELAFGTAMQALLPHGLMGLMFAAIFASQMATLSAQMVNSSALASRNLYRGVFRPAATDHQVLLFGRIAGVFLVGIGVYLALALDSVATALTMLLEFTSIMGVVMWAGILWRRANSAGAWAGVCVLFVMWFALGPPGMLVKQGMDMVHVPAFLGHYGQKQDVPDLMLRYLPPGILALVVVSLLTKPQSKKQLDNFYLLLKTPVGQEQALIDAGVPVVYSGSHQANALEARHPTLVHWGGALLAAVLCVMFLGVLYAVSCLGG